MKMLDLFAGIGGFSLAGHWAGWQTAAFVEWDKFCQKVLAKNFPNVPIYGDIKDFHYEQEREKIGPIDLVCGGFPCQPFSHAGKRNGTADDRYLWPEMLRVIGEVKPSWVVGENVAGLLSMDGGAVFEEICASLEAEGYAIEAFVLPAISKGAPHRRDRIWIVAHHVSQRRRSECQHRNARMDGSVLQKQERKEGAIGRETYNREFISVAHPESGGRREGQRRPEWPHTDTRKSDRGDQWREHWYEAATRLCGIHDGLSRGMDRNKRLKALGNAIVPQIAFEIFKAINETNI